MPVGEFLKPRKFLLAGLAVGGPEIEDHDLSLDRLRRKSSGPHDAGTIERRRAYADERMRLGRTRAGSSRGSAGEKRGGDHVGNRKARRVNTGD
jgi:hypothetical protein